MLGLIFTAKQDGVNVRRTFLFLFYFVLQDEVLSGFNRAVIFDYLDDGVVVSETAGKVVLAQFLRDKNVSATFDVCDEHLLCKLDFSQHDVDKDFFLNRSQINNQLQLRIEIKFTRKLILVVSLLDGAAMFIHVVLIQLYVLKDVVTLVLLEFLSDRFKLYL